MIEIFRMLKGVLPQTVIIILFLSYIIINKVMSNKPYKIINNAMKIFDIKYLQILKEQMEYVEGKIGAIREKNETVLKQMLKLKGFEDHEVDNFPPYKSFMITLEFIIVLIKDELRRDFKDIAKSDTLNNPKITNYEEIGFSYEQYYEPRLDEYVKMAQRKIRADWVENDFLSRDELKAELVKGEQQNRLFLRDLYIQAMRILITKNKRIKELEKTLR